MNTRFTISLTCTLLFLAIVSIAHAEDDDDRIIPLSGTSFRGFLLGVSVEGPTLDDQGSWSSDNPAWDEEVKADTDGNIVWRVSNAVTSGSFGDMPFAPRPAGIVTNTVTDPDNSEPFFFAGESSTGAAARVFQSQFSFKSATGVPQPGLRITVSIDNGEGARQSFVALVDTGIGIDVQTQDVNKDGTFTAPITIASDLSYTEWHTLGMEATFRNGPRNDRVRYLVNGRRVHTGPSWEQFYRNFQAGLHPLGVPVQTLLFRLSGIAAPTVAGNGFYVDNVFTALSDVDFDEDEDEDDVEDDD